MKCINKTCIWTKLGPSHTITALFSNVMGKLETFVNHVVFDVTGWTVPTNCVQSLAWIKISPIELKSPTRKSVFNCEISINHMKIANQTLTTFQKVLPLTSWCRVCAKCQFRNLPRNLEIEFYRADACFSWSLEIIHCHCINCLINQSEVSVQLNMGGL